jgi:leucyl/phenylalanyl-tRNA--protein transferase
MPVFLLQETLFFPPVQHAEPDGLLAVGGDLSADRLLLAYRSGIFPWYDEAPILWWSPDPRFVLFPECLKISKSMRPVINQQKFRFTINTAFREVMEACGKVKRANQNGTWINADMIAGYTQLHHAGFAISAEAWEQDKLVGGLYGVLIGQVFFGESMFSISPNASKFAFVQLVQYLKQKGIMLIDCQVYTEHLESLGAQMINREKFLEILENNMV